MTLLQNVVRPSIEGSRERRNTSQRKCGNVPLPNVDPHSSGDEDEHDDQDDYWSCASSQGASGDASDASTAQSTPSGWDSNAEDEEPHSYQSPIELIKVAGEEVDNQ